MVRAVATETRSIVYHFSPDIVRNVYNADRKEVEKMVALTMISAKKFGPSIIYIDECEKFFPGKKKKKKGQKKKGGKKGKDAGDAKRMK